MSKSHRGKGTRELPLHGRGVCPNCKRTGIKLLYEQEVNGEKIKVCKICNSTMKRAAAAKAPAAENTEAAAS
jgi:hypothetical protein